MTDAERAAIDGQSYEQLLRHWRHAPVGDESFLGEHGEYYSKVMFAKRDALLPDAQVAASKSVGWDNSLRVCPSPFEMLLDPLPPEDQV